MIHLPEVPDGPPIAVSASLYVAYRQCPDSALARLQGHYGPDTRPSLRGGLAHQVFAHHLESGPIDSQSFGQTCRQMIGGSNLNHKMANLRLRPSEIQTVIDEVQEMYARFRTFPGEGFRGAEIFIDHEPQPGVTLRGRIDAVFDHPDGLRLVDWKTGEVGDPEDQLLFYAVMWTLDRGTRPATLEAASVRTGERHAFAPTDNDLQLAANRIAETVADLRGGLIAGRRMERAGGPWCRYCAILDECSDGRAAVALADGRPVPSRSVPGDVPEGS